MVIDVSRLQLKHLRHPGEIGAFRLVVTIADRLNTYIIENKILENA